MGWIQLALGRQPPGNPGERRFVGIVRGAATALASRGLSVTVSFLIVPLTVGYLGGERYGAWIAISGFLTWFQLADFGLSKGLTNNLADANARGRPEVAQRYVATAFWLLVAAAAALGIGFVIASIWVDWSDVFNVHEQVARAELPLAIALAFTIFALGFPLSLVDTICTANQEGAIANLWTSGANLVTLACVVIVTKTQGGMPALVLAIAGARLVVLVASAVWLFAKHRTYLATAWSRFDRGLARHLASDGAHFFVIQIAALLLFSTDNFIIARVLGASSVTPYSVTWKLFSISQILASIAFTYLWPAYVDAAARGDVKWISRTFRFTILLVVGFSVVLSIVFVVFGKSIIRVWAGAVAVPPGGLLVWMAAWSVIYAFMSSQACILNATKHLRGQMIYSIVAALVNIGLSVWWAGSYGISGVIAATVISFLVFAVVPCSLETLFVFRELHRRTH